MGLTIEQMQGASLETKEVETPEWGGVAHVRALPAIELPKLQKLIADMNETVKRGQKDGDSEEEDDEEIDAAGVRLMAKCVCFCLSDENGDTLADDGDALIEEMVLKPLRPMRRCLSAALELNGQSDDAVERAVKN